MTWAAPTGLDDMQDGSHRAEDPVPPGLPIHPRAGFVTVDHRALLHRRLDDLNCWPGGLAGSLHHVVYPALTDFYPV